MSTKRLKLPSLYLVVDTTIPEDKLLTTVELCLAGGVDILQLWGEKKNATVLSRIGGEMVVMAHRFGALCLVGDDIDLCRELSADGVHLDGYAKPSITPLEVKKRLGSETIVGVTCGNSVEKLRWAEENAADYISFCAIFPTPSVASCEIVPLEMIRTAKRILTIPVFASGGITIENIDEVLSAGADGVAVVSALLQAPDPKGTAQLFKQKLARFVTSSLKA
jgi:thiamine-phosphate pyrophosphorylase